MEHTTTPAAGEGTEAEEATMRVIRTFEKYRVVWNDRSEWTGYQSVADAAATIDALPERAGFVVVERFAVEGNPAIMQPSNCGAEDVAA